MSFSSMQSDICTYKILLFFFRFEYPYCINEFFQKFPFKKGRLTSVIPLLIKEEEKKQLFFLRLILARSTSAGSHHKPSLSTPSYHSLSSAPERKYRPSSSFLSFIAFIINTASVKGTTANRRFSVIPF